MASEVVERWLAVADSMQRQFYLLLAVSLVILYLILESGGLTTIPLARSSTLRSAVQTDLDILRPLIALGDSLRTRPRLIADYRRFARKYLALENAAEQALRSVKDNDPRWRSLDPVDRRLAREVHSSLASLDIALDFYDLDNLRAAAVQGIDDYFLKLFVTPHELVDSGVVFEQLAASYRVAHVLGAPVDTLGTLPASFFFEDFVRTREPASALPKMIAELREDSKIAGALEDLGHFCEANGIGDCSVAGIEGFLLTGELRVPDREREKVEITFLPTGIERQFFIAASPLALLVLLHLYLAQWRKFRALLSALLAHPDSLEAAQLASSWLVTQVARGPRKLRSTLQSLDEFVITLFVWGVELLPLIAECAVVWFLRGLMKGGKTGVVIWTIPLLCLVLSVSAYLALLREQRAVEGLVIRAGGDALFWKGPAEPQSGK